MNFERLSRQSVPEKIIENIKEQIISGDLSPGDRLPSETRLSELFGVGRGTIREAMKALFYLGLIDRDSSRNTFVSETAREKVIIKNFFDQFDDYRDTFEMIEIRKIIEPEAAALAATRRDKELLKKLEHEFSMMEKNEKNTESFIEDDSRFHQLVFLASGNNIIYELMQSIQTAFISKQALVIHKSSNILPRSLEFHRKVLDSIRKGDAEKARKIMKEHIIDIENVMYDIVKKEQEATDSQE
ncbi:MAG: FadR/GntR family transcriptional regulator [Sphaerochaetaceae bacterium]